jgi:hypothetical protein
VSQRHQDRATDQAAWRREHKQITKEDEMCSMLFLLQPLLLFHFVSRTALNWIMSSRLLKQNVMPVSEKLLGPKYNFIFFTDPDVEGEVELQGIVGIEWKVMRPARDSKYIVVTQLVERNGVAAGDDDHRMMGLSLSHTLSTTSSMI